MKTETKFYVIAELNGAKWIEGVYPTLEDARLGAVHATSKKRDARTFRAVSELPAEVNP